MTTQNSAPWPPRALIAMSGGVDSSVAARLMQRDGYDCTGITMRLTHNEMLGQSGFHTCCSEKDIEDAAEVAFALDIPLRGAGLHRRLPGTDHREVCPGV